MKRALARKWAKALESGDYKQTTGGLRDKSGFCCLGVLCNIHAQEHPEMAATQTKKFEYFGEDDFLPLPVLQWSGITNKNGDFLNGVGILTEDDGWDRYEANSLIDLNDTYDYDFKAIAKVIRKHWKDL